MDSILDVPILQKKKQRYKNHFTVLKTLTVEHEYNFRVVDFSSVWLNFVFRSLTLPTMYLCIFPMRLWWWCNLHIIKRASTTCDDGNNFKPKWIHRKRMHILAIQPFCIQYSVLYFAFWKIYLFILSLRRIELLWKYYS